MPSLVSETVMTDAEVEAFYANVVEVLRAQAITIPSLRRQVSVVDEDEEEFAELEREDDPEDDEPGF